MLVGTLEAEPYSCCASLDNYRLPRAIVHVKNRSFVAWNKTFLSLTGFSDDQLWSLNAKDCITLGNPVAEVPGLVSCIVRTADAERFLTGHASIGDDGSVYIMPGLENGTSDAFEQGRVIGRQEERGKIKRIFHDAASPKLSVALVTLAEAERELKAKHAPQAHELAKVTRLLEKVFEKIVASLEPHQALKDHSPRRGAPKALGTPVSARPVRHSQVGGGGRANSENRNSG
jgi:hypothetical protein